MWRFVIALLFVSLIGNILLGQVFNTLTYKKSVENKTDDLSNEQIHLLAQVRLIRSAFSLNDSELTLSQWLQKNSQSEHFSYRLQSLKDYPLPDSLLNKIHSQGAVFLESNEGLTAYAIMSPDQVLLITQTNFEHENLATSWLFTVIFYLILLLIILMFLTPFLLRLHKLRAATIAFGEGQLNHRLTAGSLWYLQDIELAFNQMAEKLAQLMQDIKLLSGGLSHELRTPLARIRMGLDTLCETNDPVQRANFESRINESLDDMESVLHALLHFSRLQHTLDSTAKTKLNLIPLLEKQCNNAYDPRCQLNVKITHCYVLGDIHFINLLISNLLTNALKYAKKCVMISCYQDQRHIYISISDDGCGIDPKDRDKVFKPFVRLANQPKSHSTGYGIGLAFTERVVRWLGGHITIDMCQQLGGACFVVKLPKTNPQ